MGSKLNPRPSKLNLLASRRHDNAWPSGQPARVGLWTNIPGRFGRAWRLVGALGLAMLVHPTMATAAPIVDAAQRSVEVPVGVTGVVPAGAPAQILLHALSPGLLSGLVEPFTPAHGMHADAKITALPQIPQLTRTDAPGDVAFVASLKPGLVVDYGSVSARFVAADEKIQKELSIPTLIFGGKLTEAGSVAKTLGGALGVAKRGDAIAALADDIFARAKPLSDLADDNRVGVYLARGHDGLTAARSGTSFDEPIRLAGGKNVVRAGNGTFQRLSVEEVVALAPAVVIFGEKDALTSPLRAALPKSTKIVLDAGEPYKALTGPPSLNRLVGLAALPAIFYPGKAKADPDFVLRAQTMLFPGPVGFPVPAPLQVQQ